MVRYMSRRFRQVDVADYRVRIFSLNTELPFAGHPTLGTALGHIHVSSEDDRLWVGGRAKVILSGTAHLQ